MKILLVKPPWPYPYSNQDHTYNRKWPPLSLMNCAAILEEDGHEVEILDAHWWSSLSGGSFPLTSRA